MTHVDGDAAVVAFPFVHVTALTENVTAVVLLEFFPHLVLGGESSERVDNRYLAELARRGWDFWPGLGARDLSSGAAVTVRGLPDGLVEMQQEGYDDLLYAGRLDVPPLWVAAARATGAVLVLAGAGLDAESRWRDETRLNELAQQARVRMAVGYVTLSDRWLATVNG